MSRKFKETALLKEGSQVSSHAAAAQTQSSVELDPTERVGLRRQDWLLSLLLVILTMVAYLPAWNGTPIWDDDAHLTKPRPVRCYLLERSQAAVSGASRKQVRVGTRYE